MQTENNLRVEHYTKSMRQEVFSFLRDAYSERDSDRLIGQWNWKYDANPFNQSPEPNILLLKDDTGIMGLVGAMNFCASIRGKEKWITHSCDLIVHPKYRGKRLSRHLAKKYILENPIDFGWMNPGSTKVTDQIRNWGRTQYYLVRKVLDFRSVLEKVVGKNFVIRLGGDLITRIASIAASFSQKSSIEGVSILPIDSFDNSVDALWQRVSREYQVILKKDHTFLNWRYTRRPDAKYVILSAMRGSDMVGYLVLRLVEKDGLQQGFLVDFLVEPSCKKILTLLVKEAEIYLKKKGAQIISSWVSSQEYLQILYGQGFFPVPFGQLGSFQARVDLKDPEFSVFQDVDKWLATMGDGDLEMSI